MTPTLIIIVLLLGLLLLTLEIVAGRFCRGDRLSAHSLRGLAELSVAGRNRRYHRTALLRCHLHHSVSHIHENQNMETVQSERGVGQHGEPDRRPSHSDRHPRHHGGKAGTDGQGPDRWKTGRSTCHQQIHRPRPTHRSRCHRRLPYRCVRNRRQTLRLTVHFQSRNTNLKTIHYEFIWNYYSMCSDFHPTHHLPLFNIAYLYFLSFTINIFVSFIFIFLFSSWHLAVVLFSSLCFS